MYAICPAVPLFVGEAGTLVQKRGEVLLVSHEAPRPRLVRALSTLLAPVPPLVRATTPVTLLAVPVVFWFRVGKLKFEALIEDQVTGLVEVNL